MVLMLLHAVPLLFLTLSSATRDVCRKWKVTKNGVLDDTCLENGQCVRLVVAPSMNGSSWVEKVTGTQEVQIRFSHCAQRNKRSNKKDKASLPHRFAYGEFAASLTFVKKSCDVLANCWVEGVSNRYIKNVYAIKVKKNALHGAHRFKDDYQPALQDELLDIFNDEKSMFTWSSHNYGLLSADELVGIFEQITSFHEQRLSDDETLRLVVDIRNKAGAVCPPLGPVGNTAFSSSEHFRLMIFGSARGCDHFQEVAPPGTETYCMSSNGDTFNGDLRAWAVVVDLHQAQALVRNPALENDKGLAHRSMPENILKTPLKNSRNGWRPSFDSLNKRFRPDWELFDTVQDLLAADGYYKTNCRYVSYSPERYLNTTNQTSKVKVMLNANFFGFIDVRDFPCSSPIGPVVADGQIVQTVRGSEEIIDSDIGSAAFNRLKASHVLVMVRGQAAFIYPPTDFEEWFEAHPLLQQNVSAITGQQVLKAGQPIDLQSQLASAGAESFWTGKNARSVVGLQSSGPCPVEWHLKPQVQCSDMLVLLQFEKHSQGSTVITFFEDGHMKEKHRVPSAGATMNEVQHMLQFLMLDEALNLDGSGSSSMWTSIGDLPEKRSQPSDLILDKKTYEISYSFRPSPIVFGFGDLP